MNRNASATAVLGRLIVEFDRLSNGASRINHHGPGQVGNFRSSQASLERQQYDNAVTVGVPGGLGEPEQVRQVLV
jgi:hypothetical protein